MDDRRLRFEDGARRALAVVTGRYRHAELPDLESPSRDAEAVNRILGKPEIGGFDPVDTLLDPDVRTANNRIYDFFASAKPDEFLFAYFSCHGRRTPNGRLYLTTIDTDPDRLPPTAISADYLAEQLDGSRAQRIVVVIDCCHAGAFTADPRQRGSRDRILVLTAGATEYAHEGDGGRSVARPSRFAEGFFEGIETGRADNDDNGLITVREAFDYAVARLRDAGAKQTPQMRAGITGDMVLCRAPVRRGALPPAIDVLVRSSLPAARQVAVDELAHWLSSTSDSQVEAAQTALAALRGDPDERVAQAASRLLSRRHTAATGRPVIEMPVLDRNVDPLWYRRAVCYEIRVRSFADGDGDGIGDLRGLIHRLEYLQWLGVDCIMLSPIFDSPLHDDGNDISDFTAVHPDLGGIAEVVELVDAAHRRGIRVLLDLVVNHTSDQHPWFQQSRRDPNGPYGDYYVWSDTDARFTEASHANDAAWSAQSGWTYDPLRRQYYWHRFGPHTPDLNFDNPQVQDEILRILPYWLDLGVDGYRLVSAPYLFERDGTPSEGLHETHAYLRKMREELDRTYPDRVLLAWADRWPDEARVYFGDRDNGGRECDIVLFTSLMPRIFLSMRRESHHPVSTLLKQTAAVPDKCQWGLFLRNGDEMSLGTVDVDGRDYLLKEYAPLPRMRTAFGIRRRLAPMLDGDRGQLELCTALLLSLPGSPILYYGDEIGMGENLMLAGCAAIRTPMQWSTERGAGFSTAEPDQLELPVLLSSTYGFQATNVDSQRGVATSLLNTIRRLIQIRRHSPALNGGDFVPVESTNPAVLGYLRRDGSDRMLCVANFSRYPQPTELDLTACRGARLVEATGGSRFGVVGDQRWPVSLAGHGFFWFRLLDETSAAP
jgi:trehalose synthase